MSERSEPLGESNSGSTTPNGNRSTANRPAGSNQENVDTQRSLQHASMALEVALNRIVEVRRSLLQLSQSLPRASPSLDSFHAFELLDFEENFGSYEPGIMVGDGASSGPSQWGVIGGGPVNAAPPSFNWPQAVASASNRPRPPAAPDRLPLADDGSTRRSRFRPALVHSNADHAATTRGLRVAAREANRESRDDPIDFSVMRQEYDDVLRSMGLPHIPLAPSRPDQTSRAQQTLQAPGGNGARPRDVALTDQRRPPLPLNATPPSISWRSPDPRRWRLRQNLSPFVPFIAPPNPETQPLPTFANMRSQYGEPPNAPLIPNAQVSAQQEPTIPAPPVEGAAPSRTAESVADRYQQYQDSLRADSMGNDVNIDWSDDDFVSWLFPHTQRERPPLPPLRPPSAPPRRPERQQRFETMRDELDALQQNIDMIRVTRTTETQVSPPDRSGGRRGWARLDADGNEIPPDEEQELERSRTEYRLRALQQAQRHGRTPAQARHAELPVGSLYHDQNGHRAFYGSVLDSTLVVQGGELYGSSSSGRGASANGPFYVDPLPMPLASMVGDNSRRLSIDAPRDIVVPTYACLAGR